MAISSYSPKIVLHKGGDHVADTSWQASIENLQPTIEAWIAYEYPILNTIDLNATQTLLCSIFRETNPTIFNRAIELRTECLRNTTRNLFYLVSRKISNPTSFFTILGNLRAHLNESHLLSTASS